MLHSRVGLGISKRRPSSAVVVLFGQTMEGPPKERYRRANTVVRSRFISPRKVQRYVEMSKVKGKRTYMDLSRTVFVYDGE